jgi:hypothetical protein
MRYPLLALFAFLMNLFGIVILMGGTVFIGYALWNQFGQDDFNLVVADPMKIIEDLQYRNFVIAFFAVWVVGFVVTALAELVRIFFNIEKNTRRMIGSAPMSRSAPPRP